MFSFKIPTSIDYVGQNKAERFFQIFLAFFAIIGFVWGFYVQQFSQTLLVLGSGVAVTSLVILPPWPFWNRNPLKWQKPVKKEIKTN